MLYDSGKAWGYLIFAIFLVFIGVLTIYYFIKDFKTYITDDDLVVNIITLTVIPILILITIVLINNPILQAALLVIFGGSVVIASIQS